MFPAVHAAANPDKIAYLLAESGEAVTYGQLNIRSNKVAQLLDSLGLKRGDSIAIYLENHPRFFELCWAAQRSGLYYTAISSRLTAPEVAYILGDCGARALFTSTTKAEVIEQMLGDRDCQTTAPLLSDSSRIFMVGGTINGVTDYDQAIATQSEAPLVVESEGADMLYSSGTTGRPKGVKVPLIEGPMGSPPGLLRLVQGLYGMDQNTTYLSPAPLYHAAPLRFNLSVQRLGGTSIIMEQFNPEQALGLIQEHRITHSQWVPSMFVRMLKLPSKVRKQYDLSSLQVAIHAAAPCPIPVKEQMIDWWGPVLFEYYAGTEGNGFCAIDSKEWLQHRGSVGKALLGELHITDDQGDELPVGKPGNIYFSGGAGFKYHNDPDKTAASRNSKGWSTLGDIGYVDGDGYLYLTDRKAYMIISGGVNIYPQEAENRLITHPKVADVAVFGIPNEDFGEEVKAVVQPMNMDEAGPELEAELLAYCRDALSKIKCPRSIDFEAELPRHPTGKLYKRLLKDRYWETKDSRIV